MSFQLPPRKGKYGYAGATVELSHQLDGQLVVWHGCERLYTTQLPLDYAPGHAPKRPQAQQKKQPRIYT